MNDGPTCSQPPCRLGGYLLVLAIGLAAGFALARWLAAPPPAPPPAPVPAAAPPLAPPLARITAQRRAGEALYLQIDAGQEAGVQVGERLELWHGGQRLVQAVVELADPGRATLRVLDDTWAAGLPRTVPDGAVVRR